jgi:hypothetical protein
MTLGLLRQRLRLLLLQVGHSCSLCLLLLLEPRSACQLLLLQFCCVCGSSSIKLLHSLRCQLRRLLLQGLSHLCPGSLLELLPQRGQCCLMHASSHHSSLCRLALHSLQL